MGVACWRDGSQCSQGPRHSPRQRIGPHLEQTSGIQVTRRESIGKSNSLFHRRRAPLTQPRSARRAELLKRSPRTSGTVCPWDKAKEEGQGEGRLVQTSGTVVAIVPFSSLTAFSIAGVRGTERSCFIR